MRCILPLFICVLAFAGRAAGEDEASPASPVDAAVESVLAAHRAGAVEALRAAVATLTVDPWLVADALLARTEPAAAGSFAAALPPTAATTSLPGYVQARRNAAPESEVRAALAEADAAAQRGAWQEVVDARGRIEGELDTVARLRLGRVHAHALASLGRRGEAAAASLATGKAAHTLGWLAFAARCHGEASVWAHQANEPQVMLQAALARAEDERALGNTGGYLEALGNVGVAQKSLGRPAEAVETLADALRQAEAAEDDLQAARLLVQRGIALRALPRFDEALADFERAVGLARDARDEHTLARARLNIGLVLAEQGRFTVARRDLKESVEALEAQGDAASLASALNGLANVEQQLGRFAAALTIYRRALALAEQVGEPSAIASVLASLGPLFYKMGRFEEAVAHHQRAAALLEGTGDRVRLAIALGNLASAQSVLGRKDEAVDSLTHALKLVREAGDARRESSLLMRLGEEEMERGRYAEAEAAYAEAAASAEGLGNDYLLAAALGRLGQLQLGLGRQEAARASLERSHSLIADQPGGQEWVLAVHRLAVLRFSEGDQQEAVRLARQAVAGATELSGTLSASESGATRDSYADLFGFAAYVAAAVDDLDALYEILEMGRACSLRESLGSGTLLERSVLPPALLHELEQAREGLQEATEAVRAARASRRRGEIRNATADHAEAQQRLQQVAQRIEREARQAAALTLGRPASPEDVQALLGPGDALVLYAHTPLPTVWIALVITHDGGWGTFLRSEVPVDDLVGRLLSGEGSVDPAHAGALRAVLADPLELEEKVQRVLLCPTGRLGYVPFSLIFPARDVVLVPSATTYHLLQGQAAERGQGVLALGDPEYEGRALAPLPATRAEAMAIGDVTLLGAEATETRLLQAAGTRQHWRAIHLACHGLVDAERPVLSSLALSGSPGNDGMLTALEIYGAKLPADLVVLSACQTGKGRVYLTEGILGLTRSVMHAGAPRVLCSLWNVDDEATRALMLKFYELWNPKDGTGGISAAAALRQAQDFVRALERWSHPRFWAAWVLWGLPD